MMLTLGSRTWHKNDHCTLHNTTKEKIEFPWLLQYVISWLFVHFNGLPTHHNIGLAAFLLTQCTTEHKWFSSVRLTVQNTCALYITRCTRMPIKVNGNYCNYISFVCYCALTLERHIYQDAFSGVIKPKNVMSRSIFSSFSTKEKKTFL